MFGIKKKSGGAPPDIGEEDKFEEAVEETSNESSDSALPELNLGESSSVAPIVASTASSGSAVLDSQTNIRIEQLNAKLETVTNWMKQVYERFSYISESIGEMRSMNLNNEKQIVQAIKDSSQAAELVKEVQPAALRMDYKKANLRMDVLDEKLESNKQFVDSVLEQFKDLQRKAEVFIGTEGVLKLNEDTKKELIEIQKLASRARLDADKSEQIFMELKKALTEVQNMGAEFASFNATSGLIKKDIEKIKVDHSKVIGDDEFAEFKKMVDRKFGIVDASLGTIEGIKETNERSIDFIEKMVRMSKTNKENIDSLAFSIGKDNIKRVSDYEGQVEGILRLVDSLAGQVSEIKKQIGMKPQISVPRSKEPLISDNTLKMQNITVPKTIVNQIVPKKEIIVPKMMPIPVITPPLKVKKIEEEKEELQEEISTKASIEPSLQEVEPIVEEVGPTIKKVQTISEEVEPIVKKAKVVTSPSLKVKKLEENNGEPSKELEPAPITEENIHVESEEMPHEYPQDQEISMLQERISKLSSEL